jgi:putative transposase
MTVKRTEQHVIRKTHPAWKTIDQNCFYSKNLYNYANYIIRQEFINNGKWIRYSELANTLKSSEPYKELMSQPSQQTLAMLDLSWKSFFKSIKDWKANPNKYLGRPKLPGYKPKDGRYVWSIKNNSCRIINGKLSFQVSRLHGIEFSTKSKGRLICVRFIPRGSCYVMEIVSEVVIPDFIERPMNRICGIDLGVNNLVTISNSIGERPIVINGKGIKSINQFYNKRKAGMQSELKRRHNRQWSHNLDGISMKRNNRIKSFMHLVSRRIIQHCQQNEIDTLVCGLNKEWKQECNVGKNNNQKFCYIPYDILVSQLSYKCQENGIRFLTTEESYTSGTSFLDGEQPTKEKYDKRRRIQRGLFRAEHGLINADVNGACQIIKKVSPNAFTGYGVAAACLQPVILNLA